MQHSLYETIKNILAVIGAGCVLLTLLMTLFGILAYFRKE